MQHPIAVLLQRTEAHFVDQRALVTPALLSGLMLTGAALRIPLLDQPMRYDESYTAWALVARGLPTVLFDYSLPNNHILHTLLVYISTQVLGFSPLVIRLPAFLWQASCAFQSLISPGKGSSMRARGGSRRCWSPRPPFSWNIPRTHGATRSSACSRCCSSPAPRALPATGVTFPPGAATSPPQPPGCTSCRRRSTHSLLLRSGSYSLGAAACSARGSSRTRISLPSSLCSTRLSCSLMVRAPLLAIDSCSRSQVMYSGRHLGSSSRGGARFSCAPLPPPGHYSGAQRRSRSTARCAVRCHCFSSSWWH